MKRILRYAYAALALIGLVIAGLPAEATPVAGPPPTALTAQSPIASLLAPAAARLCGRSMGGRCTKGRAACSRGTAAECAAWTAWSNACSKCAAAFAACRNDTKRSCDSCIAAHDRCEAGIRRGRR